MSPRNTEIAANILLGAVFLALAYRIGKLVGAVDLTLTVWVIVLIAATFIAALLFFSLFVKYRAKLNVALLASSLAIGFVLGAYALKLTGRNLVDIVDAKVARQFSAPKPRPVAAPAPVRAPAQAPRAAANAASAWQPARPPDPRPPAEITKSLTEIGYTFSPYFNPHSLMEVIDAKMFPPPYPLGSPSYKFGGGNSITMGCTEGDLRDYPIIRKDRYGFNNDDTVYSYKDLFMLVGGSFFMGNCVHQEDTVQSVMRRNGYPAFSTGFGASGAVAAVANLKEYGEHFKPKAVLWQFYDPNDIIILKQRELRSPFLLQYLRDGFSQNLIYRQAELDEMWARMEWAAAIEKFQKTPERKAAWDGMLETNLPLVRELLGNDISSLAGDDDLLLIYERIFAIAKRRVEAWGGRIYLVMIPNQDTYTQGTIPKFTRSVMNIMSRLGIAVIDVDRAIRGAGGDPLRFQANRGWSHFNADGYRLMAEQIMQRLDLDFPPAAANSPQVRP